MSRNELRFSGSGGQGVILASVILAEAAVLAGLNAAQSQAYGPEARGGSCKAECIISSEEICFTKIGRPDFLLALTQKSLDEYAPALKEGAIVLIDDSLATPETLRGHTVYALPILKTAKEKTGKAFTANIVAVGAINGILHLVNEETLRKAVRMHIPAGTEELNFKALLAGEELARTACL